MTEPRPPGEAAGSRRRDAAGPLEPACGAPRPGRRAVPPPPPLRRHHGRPPAAHGGGAPRPGRLPGAAVQLPGRGRLHRVVERGRGRSRGRRRRRGGGRDGLPRPPPGPGGMVLRGGGRPPLAGRRRGQRTPTPGSPRRFAPVWPPASRRRRPWLPPAACSSSATATSSPASRTWAPMRPPPGPSCRSSPAATTSSTAGKPVWPTPSRRASPRLPWPEPDAGASARRAGSRGCAPRPGCRERRRPPGPGRPGRRPPPGALNAVNWPSSSQSYTRISSRTPTKRLSGNRRKRPMLSILVAAIGAKLAESGLDHETLRPTTTAARPGPPGWITMLPRSSPRLNSIRQVPSGSPAEESTTNPALTRFTV